MPTSYPIGKILQVLILVPYMINDDINTSMEVDITEEELLSTLSSLKKGRVLA
jgi:hypothetical protein